MVGRVMVGRVKAVAAGAAAIALWAGSATAHVARAAFGALPDGTPVEAITLSNHHGVRATVITYGARLQALWAPDRQGRSADVVLGYSDLAGYLGDNAMFGATVGRVANRIAGGRFALDGRDYVLSGPMHGGKRGFDKAVWRVVEVRDGPVSSVTLAHLSPDGDQGFPGELTVRATYSLDEQNRLRIDYTARTDRPTVVAMTNHSYFDMAGEGAPAGALGEILTVFADRFTAIGEQGVPTGEFASVTGRPLDFRQPRAIDARIREPDAQLRLGRGYDHNFVLNGPAGRLRLAARLQDPGSGRQLELFTDQPGLQVYSGNYLNGQTAGKGGRAYRQGDGIALEAEDFPNAVNEPRFPSPRLDAGATYANTIVFKLSVAPTRK